MGCTPSKRNYPVGDASTANPQSSAAKQEGLSSSQAALKNQQDNKQNEGPTEQVKKTEITPSKSPVESSKEIEETLVKSAPQTETPVKKPRIKSARGGPDRIETDQFHDISYEKASQLQVTEPEEMWAIVKGTSDREGIQIEPTKNRKGWRTIRIFVSSTFKDFHQEREVLVKEVFPDLRLWCEQRKLRLVECDLRWGVPKDATTEETIKICLGELDRCSEDNTAPFFLNLAGDRSGWIPTIEDLSLNLAAQYGWVYGLSVTEMEIVHGAFRKFNPNAMFMFRNTLNDLPEKVKDDYVDTDPKCVEKLKTLKSMIKSTFPEGSIYNYGVKVMKGREDSVEFIGLTDSDVGFSQKVYDFFLMRIEELYPLDPSPEDPLQVQRESHETFLDSRSQCVLGRDQILGQINEYVTSTTANPTPLLVIGTAGAGKSAVMAKAAADAVKLAKDMKIPAPNGYKKWRVFFHFVGATPGSTDLAFFLQRLIKEVKPDLKDVVSDLESLIQLSGSLLSNPNTEPVILFIDAVNQLDEDKQQFLNRWLPEQLANHVKVVVSMIEGTPTHRMLRAYKTNPREIICGPLGQSSREAIVVNILSLYNKRLDQEQLETLLHKEGSSNPLWLTLACEELRVFGKFEMLLDKINTLPDDLINLEMDVFSRFEQEAGGELMAATLCQLEVSRHGLLETELLALLGEKANLQPPKYVEGEENEIVTKTEGIVQKDVTVAVEKGEVEKLSDIFTKLTSEAYVVKDKNEKDSGKNKNSKRKQIKFLPAREWAIIYRNLKPLLRPCGDLGEGRLDFYHRSLSKAVRKKYFAGTDGYQTHMYNYWHGVLAGYFENVDDMDRKAEELPYHLELLLDNNRLIRCLLEWPVFNRLYSEDFSIDLLHSWRKAGGYSVASALYKESCKVLKASGISLVEYGDQIEKVIMFLIQAGEYKDAFALLEERLNIEEKELGSRPEKLADIYQLMAKCKSEVVKNFNFITMDTLDDHKDAIEYCQKCLEVRKNLIGDENEFKTATINVVLTFHLTTVAELVPSKSSEHRADALEASNLAIAIFEKTGDIGHLADAIMTQSFIKTGRQFFEEKKKQLLKALDLCLKACGEKHSLVSCLYLNIGILYEENQDLETAYDYFIKWNHSCVVQLEKAMDLCMKAYGEKHLLACRLYINTGILYEDNQDLETAYDYFVKWNDACIAVLGADHPKSIRARETLAEPTYVNLRKRREKMAAGSA